MENERKPLAEHKSPAGKQGLKEFFALGEVGGYFFRKKDPTRPSDINIKMMHGINKISIIVFLIGIIYIVVRKFL
jgi:Ni,Fe-hydrogenase I cytochrome b subunit